MNVFITIYTTYINWLLKSKKLVSEETREEVQRLVWSVSLTAILMWSYLFNTWLHIDNEIMRTIALSSTLLHLFSPLFFKLTKSTLLSTHIFLGSGFVFQYTHAYYTGGFYSPSIIWFSVLPLIGGMIRGRVIMYGWYIFCVAGALHLFFRQDVPPSQITEIGRIWSHFNIVLGYAFLNMSLMRMYIIFKENNKEKMDLKNDSIKQLLRIICHDIANPLTSALTALQILRKRVDKEDKMVTKSLETGEKSLSMVSAILEQARSLEAIDAGKVELKTVNVSLNDIVLNALVIFEGKLKEKNILLEYDMSANENIVFLADDTSVKNQVFSNLFSNSIKFLNEGGIIDISVKERDEFVEIIFSDSGEGMDEETLRNIFRKDIKTSHVGTKGEKGTGFGMPILKSTLDAMGATITVSSVPKKIGVKNHGTKFIMTFLKEAK